MTVLPSPSLVPAASSPAPRRGSGPEIFTFDPLPERAAVPTKRPSISRAHRKRTRRVLYPQLVSVARAHVAGGNVGGDTTGP